MSYSKDLPYNDLPLLPPSAPVETIKILKKAILARAALASTASHCKRLPNEGIFYSSLFLKEAKDSSEIENIVTTNDELFQALSLETENINPNAREVLHYTKALWNGWEEMQKRGVLTTNTFIKIVNTIKENQAGIRTNPGTKIVNQRTGTVIYTPPEGSDLIREKLKNLEVYYHADDGVDPLIKMAVGHYQFEAIHPFSDGNGRTGRIINIIFLGLSGLLEHPMLFLSKYIIESKDEYYIRLRAITEKNDWEPWILYMLDAVEKTSKYTQEKIEGILNSMKETKEKIRKELPGIYTKDLLEILFRQPYCKIKFLLDAGIAKRATASVYLKKLEKIGILRGVKVGREMLYVNTEFYNILKR